MKLEAGLKATAIGALIAGIFGIIYMVYAAYPIAPPYISSDIEIYNTDVFLKNGETYINVVAHNPGKDNAIISGIDIVVINSTINKTPVLIVYDDVRKDSCMGVSIRNVGWGPAIDFNLEDLYGSREIVPILGIDNSSLTWQGDIDAGETLDTTYWCLNESEYFIGSLNSGYSRTYSNQRPMYEGSHIIHISYRDVNGNSYNKSLELGTLVIYKFNRSASISTSSACMSSRIIKPLEVIDMGILDPEKNCPFEVNSRIYHELPAGSFDILSMKIDSEKSAHFKAKAKVHYGSGEIIESEIPDFDITIPNW